MSEYTDPSVRLGQGQHYYLAKIAQWTCRNRCSWSITPRTSGPVRGPRNRVKVVPNNANTNKSNLIHVIIACRLVAYEVDSTARPIAYSVVKSRIAVGGPSSSTSEMICRGPCSSGLRGLREHSQKVIQVKIICVLSSKLEFEYQETNIFT